MYNLTLLDRDFNDIFRLWIVELRQEKRGNEDMQNKCKRDAQLKLKQGCCIIISD